MNNYTPQPADTSSFELSEQLKALTENMARNVHEVWAAGRIAQGWTFGETRDDLRKLHPCLVPYDSLPESEREYDRQTAIETLKLIISLGFKIEKES